MRRESSDEAKGEHIVSLKDCRGSAWAFQQLMQQAKADQVEKDGALPVSRIERFIERLRQDRELGHR